MSPWISSPPTGGISQPVLDAQIVALEASIAGQIVADNTVENSTIATAFSKALVRPGGLKGSTLQPRRGTVGRSVKVFDDGLYNAFPGIIKTAAGGLVSFWRAGTNHDASIGTIKASTSPDGALWATATTIATDALDLRDPCGFTTRDGVHVISLFKFTSATSTTPWVMRSTNDAASWSALIPVVNSFTAYAAICGPATQLADGRLVLALYGKDTGDTFTSVRLSYSADEGATWTAGPSVVNGQTLSANYNESCPLALSDGRLLVMLRNDTSGSFHTAYSSDNGATFTAPAVAFTLASGRPITIETTTGALLSVYRGTALTVGSAGYRMSFDLGVTWTPETLLYRSPTAMMYAALVETSPGVVAVALGSEGPSAALSKITFRYLLTTGATSPMGDSGQANGVNAAAARVNLTEMWDTLDRADTAALIGQASDSGHEYLVGAGTYSLTDRRIQQVGGGSAWMLVTTFSTSGRLDTSIIWSGTAANLGLIRRYVDSANFLFFVFESPNIFSIKKVDAGAVTVLATVTDPTRNLTASTPQPISFCVRGDQCSAYVDGDRILQYTLTAGEVTKFSAAGNNKVGFYSTSPNHRFGPWTNSW